MELIKNQEFGGERPLYARHGLQLEDVVIHVGESSIKEGSDIVARRCQFEGKYVFWCCERVLAEDCLFTLGARSSVWHSRGIELRDCRQEAPKMFRESADIRLRNVVMPHAQETFWCCDGIEIDNVEAHEADYIFMHCSNVKVRGLRLFGNYGFQHARNVEIYDSDLQSKDALWETENITVYDSFINGEYLAWHSKNVRLVRCRIGGTQPLCYAEGLVLEDCTFEPDADLAFEYSDVQATVKGHVISIKNPRSGSIRVDSCGELILDDYIKAPGDCRIEIGGELRSGR